VTVADRPKPEIQLRELSAPKPRLRESSREVVANAASTREHRRSVAGASDGKGLLGNLQHRRAVNLMHYLALTQRARRRNPSRESR
jgi:hypothetical protein